ncbi:MAG: hypothetical protein R3C05_26945 [Pirellulaceae bacterium]
MLETHLADTKPVNAGDDSSPIVISGTVYNNDGLAADGALVGCWCRQWDQSAALIGFARCDSEGSYRIDATGIHMIVQQRVSSTVKV